MAKKVEKKIQRVETVKISERFKNEKTTSIEDLKMKLTGIKNEDVFSHLKNRLISNDDDPLITLKNSLMINSEEKINSDNEVKEEIFEDILDNYDTKSEEEILEDIIWAEKQEDIIEIQNYEKTIEENIEDNIKDEKYYYKYNDSYNNNLIVREVEKRKNEKILIHIALNNIEHESYIRKTSEPFEIYHNDIKILDFYQFKKDTSVSYNFKKDIYILRNNLVIDSKTYLLEEIEIINIKL